MEAIKKLQDKVEEFNALVEDACDYILEVTDESKLTGDPSTAIALIRWLRSFNNIIGDIKED